MFHPDGPSFWELVVEGLQSTERGYDMIAPKFDNTPFRTPDWIMEPAIARVGEVDRALDVCCGTGAAMRLLRPHCRRDVVGIDFSDGMMQEAARRLAEGSEGSAAVGFVRGDALEIPFEGAFDVATSFGAFGHVLPEDEPRFVNSIRRALKLCGRFVFVTSTMPPKSSARYWLARGFNAAMHVRNAIIKPEFIMYYLTFLLPDASRLLEDHGFSVEVHEAGFPKPFEGGWVVVATRVR